MKNQTTCSPVREAYSQTWKGIHYSIIETSCHFHLHFSEFTGHPAYTCHFTHWEIPPGSSKPWTLPAPPLPVWDSCTFTPGIANSHNPEIPWCLEMHSPSLTVAVADLCQFGQVQKCCLELKLFHDLICQCLNTNKQYYNVNDIILQEIDKLDEVCSITTSPHKMYTCLHHLFIYTTVRPRCRKQLAIQISASWHWLFVWR